MATLTVRGENGKGLVVLKGAREWIETRATAYRKKGFDVVITWRQK